LSENNILIKSEKVSQKKKISIAWIAVAILLLTTIVAFAIDYSGYKKGQEFGLTTCSIASELGGSSWFSSSNSYAEKCEKAYRKLNAHTYDITINGKKIDASDVRAAEDSMRKAFAKLMNEGGFDRYNSYSIANWFKYTNPIEYYTGYYALKLLPLLFYLSTIFSIIFTFLIKTEAKKEVIVYEDSVLCKINNKKSKQLVFGDINSVDFGKNTLKITGVGAKFTIKHISNAEEINSILISKKNASINSKTETVNQSNADELKKYKELLDQGIISQEEFNAKKSQLLGL